VSTSSVGGQFLGDEYRLAFPLNGAHGSINSGQIVEFVDEVFYKLQSAERSRGYAPVVRALLTIGAVSASDLNGFGYLKGGVAFDALSKLSKIAEKEDNLLVSNIDIGVGSGLKKEILSDSPVFLKRYEHRPIPTPYQGSSANFQCQHFFVISLTNANHLTDDTLIDHAKTIVNRVSRAEDKPGDLNLTIGPSSVFFAIREASFDRSKVVLETIRQASIDYPYPIAAAIGAGLGRLVSGNGWVSSCFESGTAIELCRITSKLPPYTLAVPGLKYTPNQRGSSAGSDNEQRSSHAPVHELLGLVVRNLTQSLELPGKRGEFFKASADPNYFPRHDRFSTDSSPASDTIPSPRQPDPLSNLSKNPSENHVNPLLPPPRTSLKSRCRKHYEQGEQGDWKGILDEITSTVLQLRDKSLTEKHLDTLTYFKADLNSIKCQAMTGEMARDEQRRSLAALWRRAILFIDEIEANGSKGVP
jgi:hypothetical protein